MDKKDSHGYGHVKLSYISNIAEEDISKIAGVSRDSATGPDVKKLLSWGHLSPLEFGSITFELHCPITVARQLMRHRTAHYNERSLRHTDAPPDAYVSLKCRKNPEISSRIDKLKSESLALYNDMVEAGAAREDARNVLLLGTMTTVYIQYDLRNFIGMCKQRVSPHAQSETRWFAASMLRLIKPYFPNVYDYIVKEADYAEETKA